MAMLSRCDSAGAGGARARRVVEGSVMLKKHLRRIALACACAAALLSCSSGAADADGLVIPFYIAGNRRIVLNATANEVEGRFLFDTGAMLSLVCDDRRRFNFGRSVILLGERVPVYAMRRILFEGGELRPRARLTTVNRQLNPYLRVSNFAGILGNDIFDGYWVELSFSRREIVLHREKPGRFDGASHAPLGVGWDGGLHTLFFMLIDIDGREFPFLVDTGAPRAFYFPRNVAAGVYPGYLTRVSRPFTEVREYYLLTAGAVSFMDRTYVDKTIFTDSFVAARSGGRESRNYVGIMGMGILMHYDLLFDYRSLREGRSAGMYFKPINNLEEGGHGFFSVFGREPELTEMPGAGFLLVPCCHSSPAVLRGLEVADILPGSPAHDALGLRRGDKIASVNGQAVARPMLGLALGLLASGEAEEVTVVNETWDGERPLGAGR